MRKVSSKGFWSIDMGKKTLREEKHLVAYVVGHVFSIINLQESLSAPATMKLYSIVNWVEIVMTDEYASDWGLTDYISGFICCQG